MYDLLNIVIEITIMKKIHFSTIKCEMSVKLAANLFYACMCWLAICIYVCACMYVYVCM